MVTRAPQEIKSKIHSASRETFTATLATQEIKLGLNSALKGTCKAILEPQEIKLGTNNTLRETPPVPQEIKPKTNSASRETFTAIPAPQENRSALNSSALRKTSMITLTPQEITILTDPAIGPGIKNNFAANKLNNDDLIVCRQLAMEPAAMLLAKYEEQELKAYNSRLAASQFS